MLIAAPVRQVHLAARSGDQCRCGTPQKNFLYLVDFKKGVEFKTYASRDLPHAKAVAVELTENLTFGP